MRVRLHDVVAQESQVRQVEKQRNSMQSAVVTGKPE